jgi:hypothetical protein
MNFPGRTPDQFTPASNIEGNQYTVKQLEDLVEEVMKRPRQLFSVT